MIREILRMGDPRLLLVSEPVREFGTAELRAKYEIPPDVRQQIQKARAEKDAAEGKTGTATPGERYEQMDPKARREEREAMVKQFPQLANL